ncbi:MAG: OmpA family protein [Chitinophagales bacterium]|nr:OmpA family protein [Chitinophagales bacterium]
MKKVIFSLFCISILYSIHAQEKVKGDFPKWNLGFNVSALDFYTPKLHTFSSFKKQMAIGPDVSLIRNFPKVGLGVSANILSPSIIEGDLTSDLNRYLLMFGPGITYNFANEYLIPAKSPVAPYLFANALASVAQVPAGKNKTKMGLGIPVGLGINWRLSDGVALNTKGGYMFGLTDYFDDNIYWSAGFTFRLDKKAEQPALVVYQPVDTDGDGIPDELDECPDVAGLAEFNGCPDTDGDGIPDKLDECPDVAGLTAFNGCPDTDGDGIPDKLDECPDVAGLAAFNGCPDTDGDGVPDKLDECPDVAGLVALKGCPDADGDGIPDHLDKCPTEAGPASNEGCPEIKEEVKVRLQEIAGSVKFAVGKSDLQKSSYKLLDEVVEVLNNYPAYKVSVEGYTDNSGSEELNQKLSTERAKVCADYLISKGISADRVTSVGFGPSNPIADNSTAAGKAKNRRTEFNLSLK